MEPVEIAIVGVDRLSDQILGCLEKSDRLRVRAICETRPPLLNKYREKYSQIEFYNDPREMVLRAKPRILLFWQNCCGIEFLDSVIEKGCWLILRPPIVGGLTAATRMIKLAEKHNAGIFVWTPWLFMPCYESMRDWLSDQQIRSFWYRSANSWTELELPAEETLLSAGMYAPLFLAQRWLGLPEQVYCRQLFRPAQSAENALQYFGVANLVYPQALSQITIGINTGLTEEEIVICGSAGQVRADPTQAHLYDFAGNRVASSHLYEVGEARGIAYSRYFERVWQSLIEQQRSTEFELKRHLGVLAILEAAALSARTGHPEQLVKIVEFNDFAGLG